MSVAKYESWKLGAVLPEQDKPVFMLIEDDATELTPFVLSGALDASGWQVIDNETHENGSLAQRFTVVGWRYVTDEDFKG